ncbi:hypothetical protein Mpsy_2423 [Methanolobus psychrophilus R15]|nr:hypothetical protein Mpsy_2423 [Methanolobus psychrophilus R15]
MLKNNTEYTLAGFNVPLVAEFDEYRNDVNEPRVIILRNVETLDGMYVQKYLVIHRIDDYRICELERGQRVQFVGCIINKCGNKILDPHDFEIITKEKCK